MGIVDKLNALAEGRSSLRWLVAPAFSLQETRRLREPSVVTPAGELWLHRHRSGPMLWSTPRAYGTPGHFRKEATDVFLYGASVPIGGFIVDVGAGVGEDVRVFSDAVGATGRVVAIEAQPLTYRLLTENVKLWALRNVTAVHAAASDAADEVLIGDDETSVGNRLGNVGVPVSADTLDALLDPYPGRISLLKMNIEGAERQALRGATETIARTDRLVISCHDFLARFGGDPDLATKREVRALLEGAGMRVRTRDDDSRPWVPDYLYASWS